MNPTDFGDLMTFHPAPPSAQNFKMSNTLVYEQIPAKLMTDV